MRKILAVSVALAVALTLSGCGSDIRTWKQLAEDKKQCEELGGVFDQWENGWGATRTSCDFDGDEYSE